MFKRIDIFLVSLLLCQISVSFAGIKTTFSSIDEQATLLLMEVFVAIISFILSRHTHASNLPSQPPAVAPSPKFFTKKLKKFLPASPT